MRSSKPKPKLGLDRAMLSMSAPKKFHFIGHRLLFVGTIPSKSFTDFRQRAMPPHAEVGSDDGYLATPIR
jgi:hypothetical protein